MLFQMTDGKGEQYTLKPQTYQMKTYPPQTCVQKLSYMLIRPPRILYNEDLLKPSRLYGKRYKYAVYHIPFPLSVYTPKEMDYLILYLHGNSSSRLQGYMQLDNLPGNVGLACFDFDGCGNRLQREFISLGKEEAKDVDIAAQYLIGKGYKVVGWGRSMGSVSLLLSSKCQIVVADSPFSSLRRLCRQNIEDRVPCLCKPIVSCLFPCLLGIVDKDIKQKTQMSINELEIIDLIANKKGRSILFMAGRNDKLISSAHTESLYRRYEGRKKKLLFQGDHSSQRPIDTLVEIHLWIQQQLSILNKVSSKEHSLTIEQKREQNNQSLSQMLREAQEPMESNIAGSTVQIAGAEDQKEEIKLIGKANTPSDRSESF